MTAPDSFGSPDGRTYSAPETAGQAATPGQAGPAEGEVSNYRMTKTVKDKYGKLIEVGRTDTETVLIPPPGMGALFFDDAQHLQAAIAGAAPAPAASASHPICHTPAVVRPELGSVIVLALQNETPEASAQELASTLAALNQGIAVVTVRGVDALRTWEPQPQAAPELAAAMAETRKAVRLAAEMHRSFEQIHNGYWQARVSERTLTQWGKRIDEFGPRASAGQPGTEG